MDDVYRPMATMEASQGDLAAERGDWMEAVTRYSVAIHLSRPPISEDLLARRMEAIMRVARREMAAAGGRAKSARKTVAVAANGMKGGRPKKPATS